VPTILDLLGELAGIRDRKLILPDAIEYLSLFHTLISLKLKNPWILE